MLHTLEELLACRYKLAKLVGYESYAHRALKGAMAKSPGNKIPCKDCALSTCEYTFCGFYCSFALNKRILIVLLKPPLFKVSHSFPTDSVMNFLQLLTDKLKDR